MVTWEEAIVEAKSEKGYFPDEYIEDWDELIDDARDIYDYYQEEEYDNFCEDAFIRHRDYLKSKRWKEIRMSVLNRDCFICQDCGKNAKDVHHTDYNYLGTDQEEEFCISLCRKCHAKRHNIKEDGKNNE